MDGKNPEAMNAGTVIPVIAAPACVIYLVMVRRSMTMMPAGDEEWKSGGSGGGSWIRHGEKPSATASSGEIPCLTVGTRNSRCGRSPRSSTSGRGSADSGGQRNSSGPISSIGLLKPRRLRGRSLSSVATQSRSLALWSDGSVPLGKY
jgi:hypothetical protein